MKRLCLNIMIHLSYQCYTRSADNIKSVYGNIFATYGLDINNCNKDLLSYLKSVQ